MVGSLRAYLAERRVRRRLRRKQERKFARWLAENPGGTYGQFYASDARRRIDAGAQHATLGIASVDQEAVKARAQRILAQLKRAGCAPHHVVVDYGCGSLWVGEALMVHLDPGNYVGLDVSDAFYAEGLARLGAEFVASRRPFLRAIGDAALEEARSRRPDFIVSLAVMHHVPPRDLPDYFARVVSLAGAATRIEITHEAGIRTRWLPPRRWQHGRLAIRAALAPLGYAAEYRRERRILGMMPGLSLVRRQPSPVTSG